MMKKATVMIDVELPDEFDKTSCYDCPFYQSMPYVEYDYDYDENLETSIGYEGRCIFGWETECKLTILYNEIYCPHCGKKINNYDGTYYLGEVTCPHCEKYIYIAKMENEFSDSIGYDIRPLYLNKCSVCRNERTEFKDYGEDYVCYLCEYEEDF